MAHHTQLTVDWRESSRNMPEAQQEALTQTLLKELRQVDAVETVERVPDADVPKRSMGVGAWMWGVLTAEIPGEGVKVALTEVFERLPGKPIDILVERDGRKIEIKGVRVQD
ncbi:MAG: hypothetical protein WA947_08145, partial [Phormidesmis sp.]